MSLEVKYQGRIATAEDVEFINRLIADNPGDSRRGLSKRICRSWNWVQPNGALRDMVCRGFLLCLERAGHIRLPARKVTPHNPLARRKSPGKVDIDQTPIVGTLSEVSPVEIRQVRCTSFEGVFNGLIAQYHYLGYVHPVGEHLKYIVFTQQRPVACLSWSSAPRHIGCRDKFIGW